MARKRFKLSRGMLFIWLFLASLILFLAPQKITSKFQFAFTRIFQIPLKISRIISLSAQTHPLSSEVVSRRKFTQLQNHLANLQAQLNDARQKINTLAGMKNRFGLEGAKIVPAGVITASIDALNCEIIINRGQMDGLEPGMFVIADNSIIGRISNVSAKTAKVKLVTDPASKLPVTINQLETEKILKGAGNNIAKINLLQTSYEIKNGDYIYAGKKPGFLEKPIVVGKIKKYQRDEDNSLLWDITVEPACNITAINYVSVIVMNPENNSR